MFQFGRFPCRSLDMTALEHRRVSPFGHLRLSRSYTPHRRFSQYNTSFIGTRRLGIHCAPLFAFRTIVRSLRLSWHATFRYYLRVDYSTVKTHPPRKTQHLKVYDNSNTISSASFIMRSCRNGDAILHLQTSHHSFPDAQSTELLVCSIKFKTSYSIPSICGF